MKAKGVSSCWSRWMLVRLAACVVLVVARPAFAIDIPLQNAACYPYSAIPQRFSYYQGNRYWAAAGVNFSVNDYITRSIGVWSPGGDLVAGIAGASALFVVGDFNHNPLGTWYPEVLWASPIPYVVEWEDGDEIFPMGGALTGTSGGSSGDCGVVRIWDVYLEASKTYRFRLSSTKSAAELFRNPGNGAYWNAVSYGEFHVSSSPAVYVAPASDWYGLVLYNSFEGSPSDNWILKVQEAPVVLTSGVCQNPDTSPRVFSFNQPVAYWTAVAVDPMGFDDKDIAVYTDPDWMNTPLASSTGLSGTDFVVGDFNSGTAGTYYARVNAGVTSAPYVIEWEDGSDQLPVETTVYGSIGGSSGSCGLVQVWDVNLLANTSYRFRLDTSSSANIRMALFRNQGSGPYWTGRTGAEFEAGNAEPRDYTAPAGDWYGLVVFNAAALEDTGGTYALSVTRNPTPMSDAICQTNSTIPRRYSFQQLHNYWAVAGVNPENGDDKDIELFDNPDCSGTPLATSNGTLGTDFVVGDFNHSPMTNYYAKVSYGSTAANYVTEWEDGSDLLNLPVDMSLNVGSGSGLCGLVRIWDVALEAGKTYRFWLNRTSGSADAHLALFRNPSQGACFAGRSAAQFEYSWIGTPMAYTAPATDYYGLVVFNAPAGSPAGDFTLRVQEAPVGLAGGVCQSSSAVPRMFSFPQAQSYWGGVAVNPTGSDDKDIGVFDNPDGIGTPVALSQLTSGTDFVVGDFNHTPTGTWYPRVSFGSTSAAYLVSWDDGSDVLPLGTTVNGSVGGGPGCNLLKVWDATFQAGHSYRVTLTRSGSADIRLSVFRNPSNSPYWAARGLAAVELTPGQTPWIYVAPATDAYGIVVFNNSADSPAGSYTLRIEDTALSLPDLVVSNLEILPASPGVGDPVQVRALVRNQGNAAAGPSTTRFQVDGVNRGDLAVPALSVSSESWTAWLGLGTLAPGDHGDEACADILGVVTEAEEGNNCRTGVIHVNPTSAVGDDVAQRPGIHYSNPYSIGGPILLVAGSEAAAGRVLLYNARGQLVRTLFDAWLAGRSGHLSWNGRTDSGVPAPAGIYFVRAELGKEQYTGTLVLLR